MKYRIEKDTLGEVEVPADVYYGPVSYTHLDVSVHFGEILIYSDAPKEIVHQ